MKTTTRRALGTLFVALPLLAACGDGDSSAGTSAAETTVAPETSAGPDSTDVTETTVHEHAHWTYEGEEGPEYWAELDEDYVLCADGSAQTPIDIVDPVSTDLTDPVFSYEVTSAVVINNGHTVQANSAEGNTLTIGDATFPFAQIHFHAPSEHTIDGVQAAAEVHFVHKTEDGKLAVVGVLIEEGDADNTAWAPFVAALDVAEGEERETEIDWLSMLPESRLTIRYSGSLTTPPCTEGVQWLLMSEPVTLSAAQIDAFTAAYEGNFRPVQPLNGRTVEIDSSEG